MGGDHASYRRWTAAYVLGALAPDERAELEAHLAGCETCRNDVAAFAPLPGLLARVEVGEVTTGLDEAVERAIADRARGEVTRLRVSRQRWRLAAVGAAALTAVLLVLVVVWRQDQTPARTASPADAAPLTIDQSVVAGAAVSTAARAWGTEIILELSGLPERDGYHLWAIDAAGRWHVAATWGPTPSGETRLTGSTAVLATDLQRVLVTSASRDDVLVSAAL
jgi:anti-sigma-K factor RskA